MKLFNESKNALFILLCKIINEIHQGAEYTKKDILQRIRMHSELQYEYAPETAKETAIVDALFHFNQQTQKAELFIHAPVPCIPSYLELQWLKMMLLDKQFSFLLPPQLHETLLRQLQDIPSLLPDGIWSKLQSTGDDSTAEPLHTHLLTIQQAFIQNKQLYYVNIDRQGQRHKGRLAPCRLEYDIHENRYSLILWNDAEQRAIKLIISRLQELTLTDIPIPADIPQKLQDFFDKQKITVSLRLRNQKNSIERCFALFASYDKESYIQDDDIYILKVHYYAFNRYDILHKILSLGAAVTVLEPMELRQDIIQKLTAARLNYVHKE